MTVLRFTLTLILFALGISCTMAEEVVFRSGEKYQLRCVDAPSGCIVPGNPGESILSYTFEEGKNVWWRITMQEDGTLVLRHKSTKKILTFTTQNATEQHCVSLTKKPQGTASYWLIDNALLGFALRSALINRHFIGLNRFRCTVGADESASGAARRNESLFLVDSKGRVVTRIGKCAIKTSKTFVSKDGLAPKLEMPDASKPWFHPGPQIQR